MIFVTKAEWDAKLAEEAPDRAGFIVTRWHRDRAEWFRTHAVKPATKSPAKHVSKKPSPVNSKTAALDALAKAGGDIAERANIVKKFKNLPPWSGRITIAGRRYNVTRGTLVFNHNAYQVSKDGKAVVNKNGLVIGEIVNGVMREPSQELLKELSLIGEVY